MKDLTCQPDFWHLKFDLAVGKLHLFHGIITRTSAPRILFHNTKAKFLPWEAYNHDEFILLFLAGIHSGESRRQDEQE